MVLPQGRFEGFCIIKSSVAMESLQTNRCADFIKVQATNGTGLWHDFEKWTNGHTFFFKAGLSGDNFNFEYDIPEQRLTVPPTDAGSFIGENRKGKLPI